MAEAQRRREGAYAAKLKRMRDASEVARALRPPKPPKPIKVKAEKPAREPKQPKASKPPKPLKLAKAKPTHFNPATPKRAAGPAGLDKPADVSRAVKIVAPRTPGRFEVPAGYEGVFGKLGPGRYLPAEMAVEAAA